MIQNFKVEFLVPFVTRIIKFEFALDFKRFRITHTQWIEAFSNLEESSEVWD